MFVHPGCQNRLLWVWWKMGGRHLWLVILECGRQEVEEELIDSVPGEGTQLSSWAVLLLEHHVVENVKTIVCGFFYKGCGLDPSLSKDPTF